jgi:branched-chain amino acid transport system permease protein
MLQAMIAGLVLGGVYAISASGIVVTYVSTGVLNFAFGGMAFAVARFYFYLTVQYGWSNLSAALVCLVVVGPVLGMVLYICLFRFVRHSSTLVKVVATIGLAVALPAVATTLLGNPQINVVRGLAHRPERVFHIAGVAITMDQVIVYIFVVLIVLIGTLVLRFTEVGLSVRAVVSSEALTSLNGISPQRVYFGVWAVSGGLAGVAGVLIAPVVGLQPQNFILLMAGAFGAVLVAKLRNLPLAVLVGLLMGVAGAVADHFVPGSNSYSDAVIPSIPFAFMLAALVWFVARGQSADETAQGGALDHAISTERVDHATKGRSGSRRWADDITSAIPIAIVAILPLFLHGSWVGEVGLGIGFAICFLSYTVLTGEGGMIWLCQISFAGLGAITTAQLVSRHWPVLAAVMAGALLTMIIGGIIGMLTIKLGDLYVALATLAFGLLIENVVFSRQTFSNFGAGVTVTRPAFAHTDKAFDYLAFGIFVIAALFVANLRRSTTGAALNAVRRSGQGAATMGISILRVRLLAAIIGGLLAGLGGGVLAMSNQVAIPSNFPTLTGLVWLAVLVTAGIRSNTAAMVAGLSFSIIPALFISYVSARWGQVPTMLFGLGAILIARNPDGVVAEHARQLRWVVAQIGHAVRARAPGGAQEPTLDPATAGRTLQYATSPSLNVVKEGANVSALEAVNVSVRFGGVHALKAVSVEVPMRTTVGLVGPNGAGKSTLFSVLSGLRRPDTGAVLLGARDVTSASPEARARAGMSRTFQHPQLFQGLTVREHLVLADRMAHSPSRMISDVATASGFRNSSRDERQRVEDLISLVGLGPIAEEDVARLPLGSCRLVEIGRCLARQPALLLLDEPFSGLDSHESERIVDLLRQVGESGVSILLIEHDVEIVMGLSERVYVLDFGEIIASGRPDEMRSNPRVQAAYLGEEVKGPRTPAETAG